MKNLRKNILTLVAIITVAFFGMVNISAAESPVTSCAGKLNINTATSEQFMLLPGIGEKTAGAVIAYRTANGPFKNVDEILNVKGIGKVKFETIKAVLATEGETTFKQATE